MRKRASFFPFYFFFAISLGIFLLFNIGIVQVFTGFASSVILPIQEGGYSLFVFAAGREANSPLKKLQDQNTALVSQLIKLKILEQDNAAFRDQFATSSLPTQSLLPSHIVGLRTFIPGVSSPTQMILDKGSDDGVKPGTVVVYKDILIGKIISVSQRLSVVTLTNQPAISFTAKTIQTQALGIVQGSNTGIILSNVLLSNKLQIGDSVITKGDMDAKGNGFPPNLLVGKIISVEKKASNLFQEAQIQSPLDPTKLTTVFLLIGNL